MPGLYLAELNQPRNVFPGVWFVRNTDPATTWPTLVQPGMPWVQTDADSDWTSILAIKVRSPANDGWVPATLGGASGPGSGLDADTLDGLDAADFRLKSAPVRVETEDYTIVVGDEVVLVDATAAPVTISLPPAADVDGVTFFVSKVDGSANAVTIEPDGAEEIDGAANRVLDAEFEGTLFAADGANNRWLVLARPGSGAAPEGSAGGDLTGNYPNPTIKDDVDLGGTPTIESDPIATEPYVDTAIAGVRDGVSSAYDTLAEIATELGNLGARLDDVEAEVASESGTTYTYVLTDAGKYYRFTNAAGCAVTVPANASVAFPLGTELHGIGTQDQVTLVADAGVTINTAETLLTAKAFSVFSLKKVGTNEWDLFGDLELT